MAPGFIIVAATLATAGAQREPLCVGDTRDIGACVKARVEEAEKELSRYAFAARTFIAKSAASDPEHWQWRTALLQFDEAEKVFKAYREAECGAIGSYTAPGSGAAEDELRCELRVTRLHTHTLWVDWLSDPAQWGAPPLPEPKVPPDP